MQPTDDVLFREKLKLALEAEPGRCTCLGCPWAVWASGFSWRYCGLLRKDKVVPVSYNPTSSSMVLCTLLDWITPNAK